MKKQYSGYDFEVPADLVARFDYVVGRIDKACDEGHDELWFAYKKVFKCEFGKYKVDTPKRKWYNIFFK